MQALLNAHCLFSILLSSCASVYYQSPPTPSIHLQLVRAQSLSSSHVKPPDVHRMRFQAWTV